MSKRKLCYLVYGLWYNRIMDMEQIRLVEVFKTKEEAQDFVLTTRDCSDTLIIQEGWTVNEY